MPSVGWLDCGSGVSGDMLLGALSDLGALDDLPAVIASLSDLGVTVETSDTTRAGLRARSVTIHATDEQPHRHLPDVRHVIEQAAVPEAVRARALAVFERLAAAEAQVHGVAAEQVEFHEVGAVDSIVVVAGVVAASTGSEVGSAIEDEQPVTSATSTMPSAAVVLTAR